MTHEYQNKGLAEFAFRNYVILSEMFFAEQTGPQRKCSLKKKKREQAPALQMQLSTPLSIADFKGKSRNFCKEKWASG